ncbi:Slp/YeaY family lipoprotein [Vibrio sp. S4M6]|uniref:Slp family lipoprotein n=1 Tax=Vibrio sinus TaxID=2946865 RepID=UPI002029E421|nr:Slp family lipoprotein [Vibrio sinus]MCL9783063.1 Slp/YeaY family lipoprotein [Vibrio sinus]
MANKSYKYLVILLATALLSACASLPATLKASTPDVITHYRAWSDSRDDIGKEVRLGGVIAKVTNLSQKTRIEVVNLPINSAGQPNLHAEAKGRFIVYVKGFLDPVTFAKGRLITVLGTSLKPEIAKVGDYEYHFPTMEAAGYYLWRVQKRVVVDGPFYTYPCLGLYCHQYYGPQQGRVVTEIK